MKILHINSYYSVSKFYKNLYDEQVRRGLEVEVYVPVPNSYRTEEFDYGSYTLFSRNHGKYDRYVFHLKHFKIYRDLLRHYRPDQYSFCHAHSLFSNGYIAMRLKKDFGVPYVVAVRNTDVNTFFKKMAHLRPMGVKILKNADQIVFLSRKYKDRVLRDYVPEKHRREIEEKSLAIPNGIDDFWLENRGEPREEPKTPPLRLLQAGNVDRNKNVTTTVKAIEILRERGHDASLELVGKIKDEEIFNSVKERDFVSHLGYQPREELLKIYRRNHLFVLPSIHETFGLVYAEAMSQGLPVIYTRGQGFDGQFEEGTVGYSVDCFDGEMIADRILDCLSRYPRMSANCLEASGTFSWREIAGKFEQIYSGSDADDEVEK